MLAIVDADRFKSAIADMQGELCKLHTSAGDLIQDLWSEMQPRGGCGNRTAFAGEGRLVSLTIGGRRAMRSGDVWRQRHVADFIQHLFEAASTSCLLYTSDAADERSSVDLG